MAADPGYGNMVCRCEKVSEAEIVGGHPQGAYHDGRNQVLHPGGHGTVPGRVLHLPDPEDPHEGNGPVAGGDHEEGQAELPPAGAAVKEIHVDAGVIGGGAAGMAAALEIRKRGARACILERDDELGGILLQCIHNGFGLHEYREDLTGPEYAERAVTDGGWPGVEVYTRTTVGEISANGASRELDLLLRGARGDADHRPGRGPGHGLPGKKPG